MKKEVIVFNYMGRHGSGNMHAYVMAKALVEQGENVVAIVSSFAENIDAWRALELTELVEVETYNSVASFAIKTIKFLLSESKKIYKSLSCKYSIKAIYCPMLTYWTYFLNRRFDARKIVCNHDPIPHSGDRRKITFEKAYNDCDVIIVHSKSFVNYVEKRYPTKQVYYMPLTRLNVYDLPDKRKAVDYDSDKINFLFFGTISKYKGLEVLADAYKIVRESCDNVSLTVGGNGDFSPYKEKYDEIADEDVTIVNRWIDDEEVESFFIGDNVVLVLPYTDATQSGVALVAQEYDVPVIATRTGGLTEQIVDEENGLLVEPSDVEDLSDAMIRVAENKELYATLKQNVKKYRKASDDDVLAKKLIEIIDE